MPSEVEKNQLVGKVLGCGGEDEGGEDRGQELEEVR
jgi:hypothetical protein